MVRLRDAAAVAVFSLLLLLACDAAGSGDRSSSPVKQQRLRQSAAAPVRGLDATRTTAPVEDCSEDVSIFQADEGSAWPPDPIQHYNNHTVPHTFQVEISNMATGRYLYNLSLSCEHFFDVTDGHIRPDDPLIFRRISPSECLVNDGKGISPNDLVEFEYRSESQYPFEVSSVSCTPVW